MTTAAQPLLRARCNVCGTSRAIRADGTYPRHGAGGQVCDGSGQYADPHSIPDAWAARVCGACGTTNEECGDHGCCDRCRFYEPTVRRP